MTEYESKFYTPRKKVCWPVARSHILLLWPNQATPEWYPEARVNSQYAFADWLNTVYEHMAEWTQFDPNQFYARRNLSNSRLVYVSINVQMPPGLAGQWCGTEKSHARPFIQWNLGDAMEGFFRLIAHETTHDFTFDHPWFHTQRSVWGEGVGNYFPLYIFRAMRMPEAAARYEFQIKNGDRGDRYWGGARAFYEYERANNLDGPAQLFKALWGKDLTALFGKPAWA